MADLREAETGFDSADGNSNQRAAGDGEEDDDDESWDILRPREYRSCAGNARAEAEAGGCLTCGRASIDSVWGQFNSSQFGTSGPVPASAASAVAFRISTEPLSPRVGVHVPERPGKLNPDVTDNEAVANLVPAAAHDHHRLHRLLPIRPIFHPTANSTDKASDHPHSPGFETSLPIKDVNDLAVQNEDQIIIDAAASERQRKVNEINQQEGMRQIPRIIHQSWKTRDIPEKYLNWTNTWRIHNPDYKYMIWSDSDNREMIKEDFPWFLSTFDSYEDPIMRADASRIFYMYKYGGVYADLDFECLKPLDPLLASHHLVLGSMAVGMNMFLLAHSIPNAWMASKPGHPMWMSCAKRMLKIKTGSVEQVTGPAMLYRCYKEYITTDMAETDPVYVAPPEYIFPYSWAIIQTHGLQEACLAMRSEIIDTKKCLDYVDPEHKAFAITFWGHSWAPAY
ncbi:hypothetical protein HDU83_006352 [Entophlyctis luteolus]|nr:hypothetical protein HDU83_006352 [Entophlyctis luteolus]